MTKSIYDIEAMQPEKRYAYLLAQINTNKQVWILTDKDGCVMLNTEDEDCVPIWPSAEFAKYWATGEWSDCEAKAIDLGTWKSRWTPGLQDDEVALVAFPLSEEDGFIVTPEEFENDLSK